MMYIMVLFIVDLQLNFMTIKDFADHDTKGERPSFYYSLLQASACLL